MANSYNNDVDRVIIKDQLGTNPDVIPILIPDFNETIGVEEGPTVIFSGDLDSSSALIWDSSSLGKWDIGRTWAGDTSVITQVVSQVVNQNNEFKEHFRTLSDVQGTNNRYTQYTLIDLANTTADVSVVGQVTIGPSEKVQSRAIAYDGVTNWSNANLFVNTNGSTAASYSIGVNANGSTAITWQSITPQTETSITSPNKYLFYKVEASGGTAIIYDVKIRHG